MSLVGNISLTNNVNGLYLGKVNIENLNVSADQLLYSTDGVNISGLNLGNGLEKVIDELKTIGNPDIQLTTNSIYVNENVSSINTAIENAEQADVIYVSSGSYSESGQRLRFYNKFNMALKCPDVGNTITEVLNGLDVTGTSEGIRISNLQIEENKTNASSVIEGTGKYYFKNVTFTGTITSTHTIELGQNVTKFITFMNCEWDEYCDMYISAQLFSQIYFINCNFGNCNITYNNLSPLLVIMSNCAGLKAMPTSIQATLVGVNVLTTGVINSTTTNINNSGKITAGESLSYVSASPIGVETAHNENNFFTGILAQNKDSSDGSSTHLLITNDQGTDFSHYGGFDMFSSNSTIQYGQFGTMPNALGISSQSSSIVLTPNAGNSEDSAQNNNIILCYDNGTKALIINDNGQLVVGANNPSYSGNTYGGDDGGVNNVLTSDGVSGLKWSPIGGVYSSFTNQFLSGQQSTPLSGTTIILLSSNFFNKLPGYPTIVDCVFNFSITANNTILTLVYTNNNDLSTVSYTQSLSKNGHHIFPVKFLLPSNADYDYNFTITATVGDGTIARDSNDFYCAEFRQIRGSLPV